MTETWEALPPEVISRIFWCTDLQLVDRLRCESVCHMWQAVLAQNSTEVQSTSVWDILITLEPTEQFCHIDSQPSMRIRGMDKRLSISGEAYIVFLDWCKLKRHLLRRVRLTGIHPKGWQLRDLFRIFQAPILQTPPVLELSLQAGLDFLWICQDLLYNTLVVLELQLLLSDSQCFSPASSLSSLQALRELHLRRCAVHSHDLSGCTQLTGLEIGWAHWAPYYVLLPTGNTVQLQHLVIKAAENNINGIFHNLQSATQLSHLDLAFVHDLPVAFNLGSLRSLSLGMCSMYSFDLSSYTQLTHVHIWGHHANTHEINLPAGSTVMLRCLQLVGIPCDTYQLRNLRDATRLTCLEFRDMYPGRSDEYVWPESVPDLESLTANCIPLAPPQQFCGYTNLRLLDLRCFGVIAETHKNTLTCLPDCFAHMTKLKKLEVLSIQNSLDYFPKVVLQLKQLCALDLRANRFNRTGLSADIMQFTEFRAMTRLDLRLSLQSLQPQWRSTEFVNSSSTRQLAKLDSLLGMGVLHY